MEPSIKNLKKLLQTLRQPTGCAWTREQTFESLAPQTLEECYELVDAIEQGDINAIRDELGDLLYHVFFYAQLGEENQLFNLNDIANVSLEKHQQRMPNSHQLQELTAEEISNYWDNIKIKQRKEKGMQSILQDISKTLPATTRSVKLQKRAAQVGFDWPNVNPVFEKMTEEIAEIKHEINQGASSQKLLDEVGDLLFVCTNLARHLNIDPEAALRHANEKFIRRFNYIEEQVKQTGRILNETSLNDMEKWWEEAKNLEK